MSTFRTLFLAMAFLAFGLSCTGDNAKTKAEKEGWHLSIQSYTFHLFPVMESLDKTQDLGIKFIEIYPGQKMGEGFGDAVFGYQLDQDQQRRLKEEAEARGIKIISSGVWTAQREEWESILSFARDMGMEFISAEPAREDWDIVEELAIKYQVKVAVHNHPSENSYWEPEILLASIEGRDRLAGACVDVGHYKRMGLDPITSLRKLEGKVIALHFKDIAPRGEKESLEDVIWGEGILNVRGMMEELKRQDFKGYFTIEYEADWENNLPHIRQSVDYFNQVAEEILYILSSHLHAQTVYYNADQFPLIGKTSDETETRYERLPAYLKEVTRPPVWNLGKNTSGLAIRFNTNSTAISAKWEVSGDNRMNHMTETGTKGLDLYAWEGDRWQPVKAGLPSGKVNERTIISNMTPKEREYMLFLPLYDGVVSLSIGIDSAAYIKNPALPYPDTTHPILVYGTSITQGGCATRPGMSYTNILTRQLNREVINLGFSGNGQLDYEIAELMATRKDASLFVLDFIPNVNADQIKEKARPFYNIIREANPDTPILFVETIIFPHSFYDQNIHETITEKNRLLREEYEKIKNEGDTYVYYLATDDLIGADGEATVDGIHLTDIGFTRLARKLLEAIHQIENK